MYFTKFLLYFRPSNRTKSDFKSKGVNVENENNILHYAYLLGISTKDQTNQCKDAFSECYLPTKDIVEALSAEDISCNNMESLLEEDFLENIVNLLYTETEIKR